MKAPFLLCLVAIAAPSSMFAWDSVGHRIVNELAMAALPSDYPAFVKTPENAERIGYLAAEPDRWSHAVDLSLKHYNWPDHYLDSEEILDAGMKFETLPSMRYDYVVAYAAGRAAHPENFPTINPAVNSDHTRQLSGFLPWTVTEYYGKLQAAFSSLKAYEQTGGTREEIANAQADVVYIMGIMGHYVGDSSQPLHSTKKFNGWVGPNPNGYTTVAGFHGWIDGGFIAKAGIKFSDLAPRAASFKMAIDVTPRADGRDPVFVTEMDFLLAQNQLVEPLYKMEKEGKLGRGDQPVLPEARALIEGQLLKGGELLVALWTSAWRTSVPEAFLQSQLRIRALAK